MNIISGWIVPEMNCARELAAYSASFCSEKVAIASSRWPNAVTSACPVYISSMWPFSRPVNFHWLMNCGCARLAILLDGVNTAQMSREELRGLTGMVLQDAWLFGGTIEENIAYGSLGATHEQVVEAAKATYVDRFVRTLPDGYQTVLDDEGTNVSAGERQLITIARAFLARPAVLILDEATSSVDTRTEVLIQHAMASLRQGRTSFVIAHRLSTIRDADMILVMENGHIVEQGTHASLLAAGGAYARLYQAQFAQAMEEVA